MRTTSLILSTSLCLAASYACSWVHASTATPSPTIKDNMKQIKVLFKGLVSSVNDPSKNAQSAQDAAQLAALFSTVQNQVPDTISALPAGEQAAALADFKQLIQKEVDDSISLEHAFEAGDNAHAVTLLKEMDDIRHDGHEKYSD